MDGGAWWAAVHGVAKSRTRLSDFTFPFHFHVLEKEMATHSSVLSWRIPGMEGPSGLPSMGSQSRTRLKRLSRCTSLSYTLNQLYILPVLCYATSLQSFPTCCDPIDCSPPDSSVHGSSRQENCSGLPFPSPVYYLQYLI